MKDFGILFGAEIDKCFNASSVSCLREEKDKNMHLIFFLLASLKKAMKHVFRLCLSSGLVGYMNRKLAFAHYRWEFGFMLSVDRLFLLGCYSLCDALEGQKGHLSQTATLLSFSPSTRNIKLIFNLMLQHTCSCNQG